MDIAPLTGKKLFVWTMMVASVIGFLLIPLTHKALWPDGSREGMYGAILYVASMHIGLTYFFYLDKDAQAVTNKQWVRFYVLPPLLYIGLFAAFYISMPLIRNFMWVIIGGWTIWHFQKQNYGIFNLVNIANTDKPMRQEEKWIVYLAGIAGILFNCLGYAGHKLIADFSNPILFAGWTIQITSILLLLKIFALDRHALRSRHIFLLIFTLNWMPLAFLPWTLAFFTCSFGHGLQYVVIMSMVGARSNLFLFGEIHKKIAPAIGVAIVITTGVAMYWLSGHFNLFFPKSWSNEDLTEAIAGLAFSITGVHYILDAGIWRLKLAEPRLYMHKKLEFLFAK